MQGITASTAKQFHFCKTFFILFNFVTQNDRPTKIDHKSRHAILSPNIGINFFVCSDCTYFSSWLVLLLHSIFYIFFCFYFKVAEVVQFILIKDQKKIPIRRTGLSPVVNYSSLDPYYITALQLNTDSLAHDII